MDTHVGPAEGVDAAISARMHEATVWALPARWYADPAIYQAERQRIFARHWLWIGREGRGSRAGRVPDGRTCGLSRSSCAAPRTVSCAAFTMSAGTGRRNS